MDIPNAFIAKTTRPTPEELDAALGLAFAVWNQLVDWIAEQGAADQEWKSYSPKAGWALRLQRKKRNIVYLAPCGGFNSWIKPHDTQREPVCGSL